MCSHDCVLLPLAGWSCPSACLLRPHDTVPSSQEPTAAVDVESFHCCSFYGLDDLSRHALHIVKAQAQVQWQRQQPFASLRRMWTVTLIHAVLRIVDVVDPDPDASLQIGRA